MNKLENSEHPQQASQIGVNLSYKDPIKKQITQGVQFYQKLCLKLYYTPNSAFLNSLKQENLRLHLDSYTLKDMNLINKTVSKFLYFKSITVSGRDPQRNVRSENSNKFKMESQKAKEGDMDNKFHHISQGVSKNVSESRVNFIKLHFLEIKPEPAEFLSNGIKENKSIKNLILYGIHKAFEILLKKHIDLSNNSLDDKCGNMISRIISRQCQRRDQVIWMYGLRNEKPFNHDFSQGLIYINISNNYLSDNTAEEISNALLYDAYLRSIDMSNNQITAEGCKKFIHVLRKNISLINLDLRGNPGYLVDNIQKRLVLKLIKNIKYLNNTGISEKELNYNYQYINYEIFDLKDLNQGKNSNYKKINVLIDSPSVIDTTFNNSNNIQSSRLSVKSKLEERSFSQKIKLSKQNSLQNTQKFKSIDTYDTDRNEIKKDNGKYLPNCNSCVFYQKELEDLKIKYNEVLKQNTILKNSVNNIKSISKSQNLRTSKSLSNFSKNKSK